MASSMSSLIAVVLSILFVPILIWRIHHEEGMLLTEFGDEYRNYMRKTKRLVPLVY